MNLGDTKKMTLYHKRANENLLEQPEGKDRKLAEAIAKTRANNSKVRMIS